MKPEKITAEEITTSELHDLMSKENFPTYITDQCFEAETLEDVVNSLQFLKDEITKAINFVESLS